MSLLPYMPFDPAWVEHSAAFVHEDARVARAALRLLFAAWRGTPTGSIPSSHSFVASATGAPQEFVAEHYVVLTEGFELGEDGLLHHVGLSRICSQMRENYSKEIDAYALSVAMSMQDPDNLGVMSTETVAKRTVRGKTALPKGFGFESCSEDLRSWCDDHGYVGAVDQAYIMEKFIDYAKSRDQRNKDWAAAFRTYATDEISRFRRYPPGSGATTAQGVRPVTAISPFGALQRNAVPMSRGDAVASRNQERMERFNEARQGLAP